MHRTITGEVLVQHLSEDARTIDPTLVKQRGRSARTLVKEGPLRLTIMALGEGGNLPPHSTDSPITIHVLEGDVTFIALDETYSLHTGDVLVFAAGVEHAAQTTGGAVFLLTVVHVPSLTADRAPAPSLSHPLSEAAKQRWTDDGGHQRTPPEN